MRLTREQYADGICSALPNDREFVNGPLKSLRDLKLWQAKRALPGTGESLCNWLVGGNHRANLTLVVGETRPPRRVERRSREDGDRKMTMAATSDVVAGLRAVVELLRTTDSPSGQIDFDAVIDEWQVAADSAHGRNLLVIGTGEVNVFSAFLHGMVEGFYFGQRDWPPHATSLGTQFKVTGKPPYHRDPGRGKIKHNGGVFLLRNPWNPELRVLWVAGLTGFATFAGCHQVATHWGDHRAHAANSIGVIFLADESQNSYDIAPEAWLKVKDTGPEWEWEDPTPETAARPRPSRPDKKAVFIGHGRDPNWLLLKEFVKDGLKLECREFNQQPAPGIATTERLKEMLDTSDFALLVMTAEDQHADQTRHARENVIHETGLFQGRLGFERAIILLEEGCSKFTNIDGLTYIPFPKGNIRAAFQPIREVLDREHIIG